MDSPASAIQHLQTLLPESRSALGSSVLPALLSSIANIAAALRAAQHVALAGGTNAFGDDQLNVDMASEQLVREALVGCACVATASSEEDPVERAVHEKAVDETKDGSRPSETYTVAFDPLDGSSIIAPNWTVGTIFGVWDGASALHQRPATSQVVAVLGVYGPRTTAVVALGPGASKGGQRACLELGLDPKTGAWEVVRSEVRLAALASVKTRYFAPANLRLTADDERYRQLILQYMQEKYTLRYAGGLVPDVVHILTKGHGVYLSPVSPKAKAKLRRLYELCPMALVLECAGGRAVEVSGDFADILERPIEHTDERGGLIFGTAEEVDKAVGVLKP